MRATLVLASLLVLLPVMGSACFRTLHRAPYETYWLGTYYESRFLSVTCFVLRGFRWTLKFIKTTYEGWHVEMEYAKCISDTYGMNIPFFSPPWGKNARMMTDYSAARSEAVDWLSEVPPPRQHFPDIPQLTKNDVEQLITSLQPWFPTNDKIPDIHSSSIALKDDGSTQEIVRIANSLYQIFLSVLKEIESLFSRTLGVGLFSCTRKYVRSAFWRWVDSAPF
ncbi:uncharacterized protein LOC113214472 [Frankliniella occidentalis]|uniref:Uncharacterized protein LOC113214472 n=1 Tax=Frankliniella occidentalis TaxID=133901 RepID=A0A6J1TFN4_FRAOC|nr:uncharacterized protein LOC113214472 [Frankliniella occidentalis]